MGEFIIASKLPWGYDNNLSVLTVGGHSILGGGEVAGWSLSVGVSSESEEAGGGELGSCEFQNSRVLLMFSRMS